VVLPFVNLPVGPPKSIPYGRKLALARVTMSLLLPLSRRESPKIKIAGFSSVVVEVLHKANTTKQRSTILTIFNGIPI